VAADAADGAVFSCVGVSPIPSSSLTRTPFNRLSSMVVARRTIQAGEMLGSYSGATTMQMAPPQSVSGQDDIKVRRGWLTACT